MSSLSWLDFSDAERRRAPQIVELPGRPETRDELGLGSIRDAFAEAMFPGVSTIQRRAAYFLLVPWTFRDVERRYGGRDRALEHTRRRELQLIEALLAADDTDGVIGARVRKDLRQVPSMIYWSGPERWGIRRKAGSREQWSRSVARSEQLALDDDGQVVSRPRVGRSPPRSSCAPTTRSTCGSAFASAARGRFSRSWPSDASPGPPATSISCGIWPSPSWTPRPRRSSPTRGASPS